ncbi:hypothetical protein [Pelagicoccus sp. SDUM812002]|uniref:hypothetical protein n=1 Tax=Pelagicoccus sp. SDUM812002 TaxID=3041266 RepID=UPI00280DFAD0|nr:hypothetical protein [Pelagicoccus sp. SDUM812002]MDQ8187297.1 hypothetical protein [Pelagicoccus sp. SDUM812002]
MPTSSLCVDRKALFRGAWIENYRPGGNATAEEIKAARELFLDEFSEEIQVSRQLRISVVRELRANVEDKVHDTAWDESQRR